MLERIGKCLEAFAIEIISELHVAPRSRREGGVFLAQRANERIAALLMDLSRDVAVTAIEARLLLIAHVIFSLSPAATDRRRPKPVRTRGLRKTRDRSRSDGPPW